jgi:hypothetical protein
MDTVIELRKLLPQFDIRLGRSGLSRDNPVDVLIVDRDKVKEASVLEVLRALQKEGVTIKSVQQERFKQAEIQVGTILSRHDEAAPFVAAFAETPPLDVEKLAALSGNEFWKAALNGQAWCFSGVEQSMQCSISADGRPLRS